jgi:hypothetical protein
MRPNIKNKRFIVVPRAPSALSREAQIGSRGCAPTFRAQTVEELVRLFEL